eukprot:RCo002741
MSVPLPTRKLRHHEKSLSNYDIFWYRNDAKDNQMVINFVYYLDKNVGLKGYLPYTMKWLEEYPRFRSVVERRWGYFYTWKLIPDFDPVKLGLAQEVRLENCSDAGVKEFIEEKFNEPLFKPGEPKYLWRLWILSNVPWGGCLLVYRLHHCATDGQSMAEMTKNIFFSDAEKAAGTKACEAPKPKKASQASPVNWGKVFKTSTAVAAGAALGYTRGVSVGLAAAIAVMWGKPLWRVFVRVVGLEFANNSAQLHGPLSGNKRTASMQQLSVAEVKAMTAEASRIVGLSGGARLTINDLLCAMVAGAFRRYLRGNGENPDKVRLGGVLPVNVRHPKERVLCENKFSLVFARLPVGCDTVVKRIRAMHDNMDEIKESFDVQMGIIFIKVLSILPRRLFNLATWYYCRFASMVITNVISAETPVYIAGSLMKEVQCWVPSAGGIGVGVSILSYKGMVSVCLIADEKQVPDISTLLRCFEEEWAEMKKAIPLPPRSGEEASSSPLGSPLA